MKTTMTIILEMMMNFMMNYLYESKFTRHLLVAYLLLCQTQFCFEIQSKAVFFVLIAQKTTDVYFKESLKSEKIMISNKKGQIVMC